MALLVQSRMGYVFHLISEDVERILYYARLQADHVDYHFSKVELSECVSLVLSDFQPYIEEKHITVFSDLHPLTVVTDKKVLSFPSLISTHMASANFFTRYNPIPVAFWRF